MKTHPLRLATQVAATLAFGASIFAPASANTTTLFGARPALGTPYAQQLDGAKALHFYTLDDPADPTFNQLLGINNSGEIAGYFGSGMPGHPNKGYTIAAPYRHFKNENYPGSAQTQVTALNNRHDTAGFWADANGNNFGFIEWNGVFTSYRDPHTGSGTVNQILGLNDAGIAVGFYTDSSNVNHGFMLNQATGKFTEIVPPGGTNVTAAAINDSGDVTGFATAPSGAVVGFLMKNKSFSEFSFPKSGNTTPLGINSNDEIVGSYQDQAGQFHGFTLTDPLAHARFRSVNDPNAVGLTVVNGVNDRGELVGFYTDAAGNFNGLLAK